MDRVPIPLGFQELPYRSHLHELRSFGLDLLDFVKQLQRFSVADLKSWAHRKMGVPGS